MTKTILKNFKKVYLIWRERDRPMAKYIGKYISANTITIIRTFGAPLVILFLYLGWFKSAFTTFVIAGLGDSLDGMVATSRRKMGFDDDPKLGAFLDAFCDKIFWIIITTGLLPMADYSKIPSLISFLFLTLII